MNMQAIEAQLSELRAVESYIRGLYRDHEIYMDSTNAMLVGAALIASVTFVGWLQPPLGYINYPKLGTEYAAIEQHKGVRFFWVFNSLSFFSAIATVQACACGVLLMRHVHIRRALIYIRRALVAASLLMALSVVCVLGAFGAAGFVVLPPVLKFEVYMMSTVAIGAFINMALILLFMQLLAVPALLRVLRVWRRHLLGPPAVSASGLPSLSRHSSPSSEKDLPCPSPTPRPPSVNQQEPIYPWEDGIEELHSCNR